MSKITLVNQSNILVPQKNGMISVSGSGGSAPPAFSPADLSPSVWFDVSNAGSVTKDGSNRIAQLNDLSGNNRHAVQATDANKPVWTAASLNSLPGAAFTSSSSQRMSFGTDNLAAVGVAVTVVMVVKNTAGSPTWYQAPLSLKTAATNRALIGFFTDDATYSDFTMNFTDTATGPNGVRVTTSFSSAAAMIFTYNGGTTTSTGSWGFYKNNASATINVSSVGNGTGSVNSLGSINTAGGLFFNGLLYELFVFAGVATTQNRSDITTYLANKWAV